MRLAAFIRRAKLSFVESILPYINFPQRPPYFNRKNALTMVKGQKYYAVRGGHGGFNGVVHSWPECQSYVNGARNVRYKKFNTLAEAQGFANGNINLNGGVSAGAGGISKRTRKSSSDDGVEAPKLKGSLIVYTDGACSSNGRKGARAGYGVYFGEGSAHNVAERLPGRATNQRAEMTAVLVAMRVSYETQQVSAKRGLSIYTDSSYTLKGVQSWVAGWKRKGWKTADGKDVKNRDIWVQLDAWKAKYERNRIGFELIWVKGHANIPGNEAADRLAVAGSAKPLPQSEADVV